MLKKSMILITLVFLQVLGFACVVFADSYGAVYAMTNANNNAIVVYNRASDGSLTLSDYVLTRGRGSAGLRGIEPVDALGSEAPLILSRTHRWLFAVNAGSDEISVFRVDGDGLALVETVDSGGAFPASLTLHNSWLYVLNSGGEGNITGFTVGPNGHLTPILDSTRFLNVGGSDPPFFLVSPAQVGFSPGGDFLVVTIKGSNEIRVFSVDETGVPAADWVTTPSHGLAPFGFAFDRYGHLMVVEPFGTANIGDPNAGAVSSYDLNRDGTLDLISASVPDFQTATCWITLIRNEPNRSFAYATNNGSNVISGYRVGPDGHMRLLTADGISAHTEENPVDIAATNDGHFLYAVNAGSGTISIYRVNNTTGALVSMGAIGGLPVDNGAVGIAAR